MMKYHSEDYAERAAERVTLELANRSALLTFHGTFGVLVGTLMALTGAPAPIESWFGPWCRLILGGAAVLCGILILAGIVLTDNSRRGWWALTLGIGSLAAWHTFVMVAYSVAAFETPMMILQPGQEMLPGVINRGYIPFVYFTLDGFAMVHFITLLRLGRPPR